MNQLERTLLESASLPTLPSIAQRLLGLLHDDVSRAELIDVISVDPAITARLLRLVNSPMYGHSRRIRSLHDALAHTGFNTVRSIALSFSFTEGLRGDVPDDPTLDQLWRTSLMTGLAARRLAREAGYEDPEQLFVAGLLADTGALLMYDALPEYADLVERFLAGESDLIELERGELASDHGRIGSLLLDAWNFPEDLCRLIARHHDPADDDAGNADGRAALLDAAWLCARALTVEGFGHDVAELAPRLVERTGLLPHAAEAVLAELPGELREIARAFEIPAERQRGYADLLADAAAALRDIAVEADRSAYLYAAATGGGRSGFEDIRQALRPTLGLDPRSGLLQRRSLERLLEAFYVRAEQRRCALGLMLFEIDECKASGEDVAAARQRLLAGVVERLRRAVRAEDELALFGRGQIAVLMPACEGPDLLGAARRIREILEADELERSGEPGRLTIGAAYVLPHADRSGFGELILRSSAALQRARLAQDRLSL